MRQSHLFTKTRKEAPSDEVSKNAQLLIKAGFIHKEMAGVYSLLPLGFKVINNIKSIVAEEMEGIGSQEIIMSTLQIKETWEKTGRWSDEKVDIWFKTQLKNGADLGLGWSHEEPIVNMMRSFISSYKDVPQYIHQFQNKLRNETRAKSGIMRCREFIMKDMYSFAATEEEHMKFYNQSIDAYMNVYRRLGLGDRTYVTSASGGVFTDKFSHEFQTLCEAGEDIIYVHKEKDLAINEEIYNTETLEKLGASESDFEKKKAAEVGNIFTFGTQKCEEMDLYFMNKEGKKEAVFLGSYGIGITRVMGVIAEIFSDDKGIIWPASNAPFRVHLIAVGDSLEVVKRSEEIYTQLSDAGIEVLFDDRAMGPGAKFADSDLIGIPYRVVISDRTIAEGGVEIKRRNEDTTNIISYPDLMQLLK